MTPALLLLAILRQELTGGALPPRQISPELLRATMRLAMPQAVGGLVAQSAIDRRLKVESLPQADALRLLALQHQVEMQNRSANAAVAELCHLLAAAGVEFLVFKGQTIAARYPHPLSRMPGDIDFYVPPAHFARASSLLRRAWGVEPQVRSSRLHAAFSHGDIEFEMHFCMLRLYSPKLQHAFNAMVAASPADSIAIDGTPVPTLPPLENIAYTFAHFWHHFLELGVGLRHLCDLAVLIAAVFPQGSPSNAPQSRRLALLLRRLNLLKAFCAVEEVMHDWLGLSPVVPGHPLPRYSKAIKARILQHGNLGLHGRRGQRGTLSFYLALTRERLATFARFYPLSPREIRARLLRELPLQLAAGLRAMRRRPR